MVIPSCENTSYGLNEVKQKIPYQLFPVPPNSQMTIHFDDVLNREIYLEIFASNEQNIFRGTITESDTKLNVESYKNGIFDACVFFRKGLQPKAISNRSLIFRWQAKTIFEYLRRKKTMEVKDSNGNILNNGDSVNVIKSLKVKGLSTDIKRGQLVKNIKLTDNEKEIEGKVNGVQLVLKTEFLRKC